MVYEMRYEAVKVEERARLGVCIERMPGASVLRDTAWAVWLMSSRGSSLSPSLRTSVVWRSCWGDMSGKVHRALNPRASKAECESWVQSNWT